MNKTIEDQERQSFEEDDSQEQPPTDIVAYNESRSCATSTACINRASLTSNQSFSGK